MKEEPSNSISEFSRIYFQKNCNIISGQNIVHSEIRLLVSTGKVDNTSEERLLEDRLLVSLDPLLAHVHPVPLLPHPLVPFP